MIKGTKFTTSDEILAHTSGGYDIYMAYLGSVKRVMERPWLGESKEHKPSWGIYPFNGIWWWKDQAREEQGTAIQFVQRYFGLSYQDALDKIVWDFGLGGGRVININPIQRTWSEPEEEEKEYAFIAFDSKPFTKKHHEFWNIVEVEEGHCNKLNCWALKDAAINRKRVPMKKDEVAFAYYCPEEDSVKLYFPERRDGRFKNNVSYRHLWNYESVKEGRYSDLMVQKSNKDMIVSLMLIPWVIATQAEAVKIFNPETVDKINSITKRPWIFYGSDDDGVKKCKEITDCNKWRYINIPKKYLPDVNDTYSFVRMHNLQKPGTGLKELEKFMIQKSLLCTKSNL